MRERCMSGSVRGARGNLRPYRDRACRGLTTYAIVPKRAVPTRTKGVQDAWARRHDRPFVCSTIVPGAFAHPTILRFVHGTKHRTQKSGTCALGIPPSEPKKDGFSAQMASGQA